MQLSNLASLDPQITLSGRRGPSGASAVDRALWKELEADWDTVALQAAAEYDRLAVNHGISGELDTYMEPPFDEPGRTRDAVVSVRVNQARFRRSVLSSYRSRCCVSDLGDERLLVASHIVPWALDSRNRLNPRNGLCLSTLHDTAFDRGSFTVTPEYRIRIAPELKKRSADRFLAEALLMFDDQPIQLPERFAPDRSFLEWHSRRFGLF